MSHETRLRTLEGKVPPLNVAKMSDAELCALIDAAGPRVAQAVRKASDAELWAIVAGELTWPELQQRQAKQ